MPTLFDLIAMNQADRPAVIVPESNARVTYGALVGQVDVLARQLASAGVDKGNRVAIAVPDALPALVSVLAAATVGAAAPLNPAYREEEYRFYLKETTARALIVPARDGGAARRAAGTDVRVLTVDLDSSGSTCTADAAASRCGTPPCSVDDPALILYTSGSTGCPKRVALTHANLSISARNVARSYDLRPDDVSLCVMPLFHVHGLVASVLATFATGGTVILPRRFNPMSFWRTAHEHGATWYSAAPTIHQLALERLPSSVGASTARGCLRFVRACSAPLPMRLMRALEDALSVPVIEAYGLTEAAHQVASNFLPPGIRKPGSVGTVAGVTIGVMDQAGSLLEFGRRGEVVVRGPNVITGYEDQPEANAAAFANGWFRTGDEGVLDSDGFLTLIGRTTEFINRGGEKISPREVEEALGEHPAVADAVCFGTAHRVWGEEVAAAVVLRTVATESELVGHCRDRLADFKCPRRIVFVETLPKTPNGKTQRGVVARAFAGVLE